MKKAIIIIASLFMTCLLAFAIYKGIPDTRKYEDVVIGDYQLYYDQIYLFTFCHDIGKQITLYENIEYQWDFVGIHSAIGCKSNLLVKNNDEFITLTEAVKLGLITESDILDYNFDFDITRRNKLMVNSSEILKIEATIFDESVLITDVENIDTIIDKLNDVGFLPNKDCELCVYESIMGFVKIYFENEDILTVSLTRGGLIIEDQYSVYDGCDLIDSLFDIIGDCPMGSNN